jgi:hypothetical protein
MTFARTGTVKHPGIVTAVAVVVLAIAIVWLIGFPRVADSPVAVTTAIEPSASPALSTEDVPRSKQIEPSASPTLSADRDVPRPPRDAEVRLRRSADQRDRDDREKDAFLGLMLFLGAQRRTQAP